MTTQAKVTEKIKLWGLVQGVGFRPFVAKCADKYGMKGEVLNIGGLVDIIVTDTQDRIDAFVEAIKREKPVPAEIVHIKREKLEYREFDAFVILDSDDGDDEAAMIPSDLSICPDCLAELKDPSNPRFMHPFISCMVCGPRYTVIDKIPYDRDNTAMIDWPMCDFCHKEYTHRTDRRYHAQTISCHDCGPVLICDINDEWALENGIARTQYGIISESEMEAAACWAFGGTGEGHFAEEGTDIEVLTNDKKEKIRRQVLVPLATAKKLIEEGEVIAVKGVGGYNLVADPANPEAVRKLRTIKRREQKPFAVMFKDIDQIRKYSYVTETEESLLKSSPKPIMLLEHKSIDELEKVIEEENCTGARNASEYDKSRFIGSFLPSMGFQYMLLDYCNRPLIVTSANPSDMPIIKDEEEMRAFIESKGAMVSANLYNERDIRVRVDDSVVRAIDGQPQMIRRSKGYAPVPLFIAPGDSDVDKSVTILATGGQLKNSFALSKGKFSYVSQFFGDLDSAENRVLYGENVDRMKELFRIEPKAVVCDMHPLYYTTEYAEKYAEAHNDIPVIKVQHHHAHVASVMAEHHIGDTVIGVSMDGTGYGTDGNIWGGEFLVCRLGKFNRPAHLKYVNMIGGDGSMKEAWKSAMCYVHDYETEEDVPCGSIRLDLSDIFEYAEKNGTIKSRSEWPIVKAALTNRINSISSSSMGRLFDAVSALLGIKDYNDYEGQCAIMLEDAAYAASKNPGASERNDLALSFHERVAAMIADTCHKIRAGEYKKASGAEDMQLDTSLTGESINKVCLTGGVFQNKILTERTLELLREDGFEVYYNVSVSPNDGGIALGQNYICLCRLQNM
ncbi:MAG: carbamoyltransferase HypF [Firmicutes bacterium]|nr:carbamoyltransferase HypF [Bacillota bacterium]